MIYVVKIYSKVLFVAQNSHGTIPLDFMATLAGIGNRRIDLEGMAEADGRNCGLKVRQHF